MGRPKHEPARSVSNALSRYFEGIGYAVTAKDLKRVRDATSPGGVRNKCNFDVEMHDEIMNDLDELDIVYIASGDSDFVRTKDNILKRGKRVKFMAYENHCAWEIRFGSWFISFESIRGDVERKSRAQGPAR